MDNQVISSSINLAAAILILIAAISPIALSLWEKEKNKGNKDKIIGAAFTFIVLLLTLISVVALIWFKEPWVALLFFFGVWSMWAYRFLSIKTEITRQQVLTLVIETSLLLVYIFFAFLNEILGVVTGIVDALQP